MLITIPKNCNSTSLQIVWFLIAWKDEWKEVTYFVVTD